MAKAHIAFGKVSKQIWNCQNNFKIQLENHRN